MTNGASGDCPACGAAGVRAFYEADGVPVSCNTLWPTREEALAAPRGSIRLGYCSSCGLIFNAAFAESEITYEHTYENSLHFSAHFQRYADELADRLVRTYDLRDKDILEIGCGAGDFLASLCERGENRGHGFDPGHNPAAAARPARGSLEIRPVIYGTEHADCPADFLVCRHVLEHIADPVGFLSGLRQVLASRKPGYYLEVPNALYTLRDMGIWDIIYEHWAYYTARSLVRVAQRAGWGVARAVESYSGQFLSIEGPLAAEDANSELDGPTDSEIAECVAQYGRRCREKMDEWRSRLEAYRGAGTRAVIWGGGSKGVTFVNALGADYRLIPNVVDINPRKHGKFVAGAGQQIVPPAALVESRPDVAIVMNSGYEGEIRQALASLGLETRVVLA